MVAEQMGWYGMSNVETDGTDLNKSGYYRVNKSNLILAGARPGDILVHLKWDNDAAVQIVCLSHNNSIYKRHKYVNVWSDWVRLDNV